MIFNIAKQGIVATFLGLFAISAAQGQIYVANGSDYVAEYAPSGKAAHEMRQLWDWINRETLKAKTAA